MVRCGVSSDVDSVPACCDEARAQRKSEGVEKEWDWGYKWQSLLWTVAGLLTHPCLSFRDEGEEFGHAEETCWFTLVRASDQDAYWAPSRSGVPGMSNQEDFLRQTQDTLEGLRLSADLGTP